jgi:hypothetical protein
MRGITDPIALACPQATLNGGLWPGPPWFRRYQPRRHCREAGINGKYFTVGAASASALASRPSEDPAARVLVIEAGGRDWSPYIHIPAGFTKLHYALR